MEHILNATYVGGIIIGGCCTINAYVYTSIIIGCGGGIITTLLLWKLKPILKSFQLEDTLGIIQIFGIPGVLGGFLTSFYLIGYDGIEDDKERGKQIGLQIATICVTLAIGGLSGLVTGFIINSMNCKKNELYFVDSELFAEDENFHFPENRYPRHNDTNFSSSGNKLDEQEREVNIEQGI
jgi:ammonia channel protein AmtB